MIYGDQSQEGFLLRDYFCCDTNELRLQIHCRPITLEKRLLAYYTQIISGFYPPCYSSCYTREHLIFARPARLRAAFIFQYTPYACVCVCLSVHVYITELLLRRTAGYCLWCCAVYTGELKLVDLSLLHCVAGAPHSIVSLVHQYATSACVTLWLGSEWGICDWRGTLQTGDLWGRRRWEEKEGSKSLCILWLGYSRQHCQHFPQRVAGKQGGWRGRSFDVYCTSVCECLCVCVQVTHSNHLNYFL